jgi:hypothetical protein
MAEASFRTSSMLPAPNWALQRTGMHKVLGRGRPSQERTRALARPRAETLRPAAELGS